MIGADNIYRTKVKRALDVALSGVGIVTLSPVLALAAVAIKLDSPGPVLFKQERVGANGTRFNIYKFRSMRTDTPENVPTHQLSNPDQYITRTGRFLRKTSLDELPQLFNIWKGDMSVIGPRPCLPNQTDLITERDKYGVNDLTPGLTGWAQVNGRDELEIPMKARFDGEYAANVCPAMDAKCFLATVGSVLEHDGIVEGDASADIGETNTSDNRVLRNEIVGSVVLGLSGLTVGAAANACVLKRTTRRNANNAIGSKNRHPFLAPISIVGSIVGVSLLYDATKRDAFRATSSESANRATQENTPQIPDPITPSKTRILITGANSYIGTSVERYLGGWTGSYEVETLDTKNPSWRNFDFSGFDVVFDVTGIAHSDIENITDEDRHRYYAINTDLTLEIARKAKASGVRQFIFMSSMIVFGGVEHIDENTEPCPANFYGDSKWQAEKGLAELASDDFIVSVLRPPMIYGRGSKGNYPKLAKIALSLPAFPIIYNKRSMLHIDNLCEFVRLIIDDRAPGTFCPQNSEYVNTSDMVRQIAAIRGHRILMLPQSSLWIDMLKKVPGKTGSLATKAFGDSTYSLSMSSYSRNYRIRDFHESLVCTESAAEASR